MQNPTDQILMSEIQRGSEKSFQTLFERYWETCYRIAMSILRDESRCKDLVQEVWINVWERREKIKNENIAAYLKQATKFRVYKELRDNPLRTEHLDFLKNISGSYSADANLEFLEMNKQLLNSMELLPARCQEVFKLSRIDEMSNQEIAEKLQISKRTVETHISQALKILRKNLHSAPFLLELFLY